MVHLASEVYIYQCTTKSADALDNTTLLQQLQQGNYLCYLSAPFEPVLLSTIVRAHVMECDLTPSFMALYKRLMSPIAWILEQPVTSKDAVSAESSSISGLVSCSQRCRVSCLWNYTPVLLHCRVRDMARMGPNQSIISASP